MQWMQRLEAFIANDPKLHWSVMKRGYWVHGVNNLRDYFAEAEKFTLDGRIESIRCPTLITAAENDRLSHSAAALFESLKCPKQLLRFTAAEGAGTHCEMQNRSLLNQRVLDWLDEQL
jgi:pimeloyl-ACP methyl ester carboxylesterase